jgi:hypothetical protein
MCLVIVARSPTLTVPQFFDALRAQSITPLVDTPAMRACVDSRVRVLCVG